MTLRSRHTTGESAFLSSEERTLRATQGQATSNKDVGSETRKNRGRIGKRKQYRRKKRQRAFKNTIVLAPFHALKVCFQNKLKIMYKKGLLENNLKKVKIPSKSQFQYEVMEVRTNEPEEVRVGAKKRKSEQGEYCHCFKKGEEQKDQQEVPGTSTTAPSADSVGPPLTKKARTETPAGGGKEEKKKRVKQSRGHSRKKKEGDIRRSRTQPKKSSDKKTQKRNIKYNTRSVTRKETAQRDDSGKQADAKTPNEQKEAEDAAYKDSSSASTKSNSSVIFIEEVRSPKMEADVKPEESVAAVTQMFDTLLKTPADDVGKKLRSSSVSRKMTTRSRSSDRRQEEDSQREVEANVVIQEPNQDSSTSERISDDSGPTSSSKVLPHKPEKSNSYIFGPKCPYQEIRESCEFGFGMPKTGSDQEVDDRLTGGNLEMKKHR